MKYKFLLIICLLSLFVGCSEAKEVKVEDKGEQETLIVDSTKIAEIVIEEEVAIVEDLNKQAVLLTDDVSNNVSGDLNTKIKDTFITFVDFIFYGGKINGKTFDDLSDEAKEATLDTFYNLDQFIEGYYPNYKEEVVELSKETADTIVDLAKTGKDNVVAYAEEKLEPETIDKITEYKDIVVDSVTEVLESAEPYVEDAKDVVADAWESAEPYVEDAKDVVVDTWNDAVDALDNWYQGFKEDNNG